MKLEFCTFLSSPSAPRPLPARSPLAPVSAPRPLTSGASKNPDYCFFCGSLKFLFDVVSSGVWWIFWRIFYRGFLGIILINLLTNFYDKLFWRSFLLTFWQLSLTKIFWWILLIFNIFDEFDDEFLMKILTNFWMNVLKNLSNFFCKFFWQILFTIFLTNFGLIHNLLIIASFRIRVPSI